MARRNETKSAATKAVVEPVPPRALIIAGGTLGAETSRALRAWAGDVVRVGSAAEARVALRNGPFDVALVEAALSDGSGLAFAGEAAAADPGLAIIVLSEHPTLDEAVEAMRSGAADLVDARAGGAEILARARAAAQRARRVRDRDARIRRLKLVCRRLNQARQEVSRQVGSLCNDLVEAYQELSDRVTHMNVATEFSSLIRQELDVECLLRTALEFILAKSGPTNAAVYLPATTSDYSLGAYVNYDIPKDTADVLLEHLAGVVAPRLEHEKEIRCLRAPRDLEVFLGEDAHWLAESCAVAFACRHEGECLAVVILFRDRKTPFNDELTPVFQTIADLFGRQLGRVIHIHHRHLPKDQWGGFAGPEDDDNDIDLAA